jgi:hypothetical protein
MKIFAQTTLEELQQMHEFNYAAYEELRAVGSIVDVPDGSIIVVLDEIPLDKLQTVNIFKSSMN